MFFLAGVLVAQAIAQNPADPMKTEAVEKSLAFDVASVKLQMPGRGGRAGGSPRDEPGRVHLVGATLKSLLISAYGVKDYQIVGPRWLGDERFIVDATMPADTTKDQTRLMLRSLLAERFKVEVYRETRDLPLYSLVVAKNGFRMATPPPAVRERGTSGFGVDGFPIVPTDGAGVTFWVVNGQARINAQRATMAELAAELERHLGSPVIDETKLFGKFDFVVTFSTESLVGPNGPMRVIPRERASEVDAREPLRDVFMALQAELGIKLEQRRGPVDTIVIDRVEKIPTSN